MTNPKHLNPKHLAIVLRGAVAIKGERSRNPDIKFDLRGADLRDVDLNSADLSNALLQNTVFVGNKKLNSVNFSSSELNQTKFKDASLKNAIFDGARNMQGIDFHNADLTGAQFVSTDGMSCIFTEAILIDTNFEHAKWISSDFSSADFTNARLVNSLFRESTFIETDLRGVELNATTQFLNTKDVSNCKIYRYAMEYLREELSHAQRMDLDVTDDIATMRIQFSGMMKWIHVLSVILFLSPYAWFLIQQSIAAKFTSDPQTITLFEALIRFIVNGGDRWQEGYFPNSISIGLFVLYLIYNIVRLFLLWKTNELELQREVTELPVHFSFKEIKDEGAYQWSDILSPKMLISKSSNRLEKKFNWNRWAFLNQGMSYAYYVMIIIVLFNTIRFLTMSVPGSP